LQRVFDVTFSGFALIAFLPILILIAIILRLTGEGEVFFLQKRIGKDGKIFNLYKFVTMLKNSPNLRTGTITVKNDPRILPFGNFLRKTKINELPQLFNIMFGDMSLVGPRPLTSQTFVLYDLKIQKVIKKVKPGLSGIGSIIFRNEESILTDQNNAFEFYKKELATYKGRLEAWYIKNQNLKNYFLIIFLTIWVVTFNSPKIISKIFPGLPMPSKKLMKLLNLS
jgi:lipopolysaccharide/colanic/teichoic acid biosynthesis glycosyltransferase